MLPTAAPESGIPKLLVPNHQAQLPAPPRSSQQDALALGGNTKLIEHVLAI
jgi:hypothetical protein